jgi:hypothetical protein
MNAGWKAAHAIGTARRAATRSTRIPRDCERATQKATRRPGTTPTLVGPDALWKPREPDWIYSPSYVETPLVGPQPRAERWRAVRGWLQALDQSDPDIQSSPYSLTVRFYTKLTMHCFYSWNTWPDRDIPFEDSTLEYHEKLCEREHFRLMLEQTKKRLPTRDASQLVVVEFLTSLYQGQLEALESMDPFWKLHAHGNFAAYLLRSSLHRHPAMALELQELGILSRALSADLANLQHFRLFKCLLRYGDRIFTHAINIFRRHEVHRKETFFKIMELKRVRSQIKSESGQPFRHGTVEYIDLIRLKTEFLLNSTFKDEVMQLVDDEPRLWPAYSLYTGLDLVLSWRMSAMLRLAQGLAALSDQDAVPRTAFTSRRLLWKNLRLLQFKITLLSRELRDLNQMLYPLSLFRATSSSSTDAHSAKLISKSRKYFVAQERTTKLMREAQVKRQRHMLYTMRREALRSKLKGLKPGLIRKIGTGEVVRMIRSCRVGEAHKKRFSHEVYQETKAPESKKPESREMRSKKAESKKTRSKKAASKKTRSPKPESKTTYLKIGIPKLKSRWLMTSESKRQENLNVEKSATSMEIIGQPTANGRMANRTRSDEQRGRMQKAGERAAKGKTPRQPRTGKLIVKGPVAGGLKADSADSKTANERRKKREKSRRRKRKNSRKRMRLWKEQEQRRTSGSEILILDQKAGRQEAASG